jgi:hypothetical protein
MSSSTQSFEYYSSNKIISMLEVLNNSETSNIERSKAKENKVSRIQNWIKNLENESDLKLKSEIKLMRIVNLKELQNNINALILPNVEMVHYMSLEEITAYESMLIDKLVEIKSDQTSSLTILLHLKIIKNHLMYKFQIFA